MGSQRVGHDWVIERTHPLEENMGKTFSDVNHASIFLGQSSKEIEIKAKVTKHIKINELYTIKETISKMKDNLHDERE